jgi:hypothetical protein
MAKTYIPSLNDKMRDLEKYITVYNPVLQGSASPEQISTLVDLLSCLAAAILKWPKPPVGP